MGNNTGLDYWIVRDNYAGSKYNTYLIRRGNDDCNIESWGNFGYTPVPCEFSCDGVCSHFSTVCYGHGTCTGNNVCLCDEGWKGQFCNVSKKFTCGNCVHGYCAVDGYCRCSYGWGGEACDRVTCSGGWPDRGVAANNKDVCFSKYPVLNNTCTEQELESSLVVGKCTCNTFCENGNPELCYKRHGVDHNCEHRGDTDESITCNSVSSTNLYACGGRGECMESLVSPGTGECKCDVGMTGLFCDTPFVCYGVESYRDTACNSSGLCTDTDTCQCVSDQYSHFHGKYCENEDKCEDMCAWGICDGSNVCKCNVGYDGSQCQCKSSDDKCLKKDGKGNKKGNSLVGTIIIGSIAGGVGLLVAVCILLLLVVVIVLVTFVVVKKVKQGKEYKGYEDKIRDEEEMEHKEPVQRYKPTQQRFNVPKKRVPPPRPPNSKPNGFPRGRNYGNRNQRRY